MISAPRWWPGCRVMLVTLAMPGLASAAPFSVESPTHVAREQADQLRKSAIGAGADAERTRIVRRYERGAGWRYLVQVDSVPTMDEVDTLAGVLTDGARTPRVVDLATGGVVAVRAPVQAVEPTAQPSTEAPTAVEPADSSDRRSRREAEGVLGAAVVAHGGVAGGLDLLEGAPQVTFQFIREVPVDDGVLKAKHVYRQAGDASRLDVSVQKGKGVDSTTVVAPTGGAWVITNDQRVSRDTDRAKDIVGRFAPDQLLRVALGVAADIETATAWRELQVIGPEGDDLVVLRPDGGPVGGLVEVAFARSDHRLRRLHIREGDRETIYFFDDYREVSPGLVVPHESEVHRDGKFIESIQVLALDISEPIPASLFSQSGG